MKDLITANELRIGNFYDDNGVFKKASPSTIEEVWNAPRSWFKPISLTDEWLLKFGFITFDSKQIYNEWFLNFDGVLKYKIFHSKYTGVETFTMPHGDKPIKLKSVHQLQNLYFALTGEELTFKSE